MIGVAYCLTCWRFVEYALGFAFCVVHSLYVSTGMLTDISGPFIPPGW